MKKITMIKITKLLSIIGINFYDILDEVCYLSKERFDYICKIKSKKRKRKGRK